MILFMKKKPLQIQLHKKCQYERTMNKIIGNISKVVEDNQKAPFSIASTPRYRGGRYSFPWIAPLYP